MNENELEELRWDDEAPLTEHNLPYAVRRDLRAHNALADVDADCWPYC